ncbi:hypothetical protein [Peribacillus sp. SI8-4]|uniref:hypothetical protein n=1 Tax=Peribacillus sp. SI8-4 TaxID=3048009 RepID=UPI0025546898|nr:hypothetical protein [Peribacillus sp. SI8-4]
MKKIIVALPVMTMLVSGFAYSAADARSAVGDLPSNSDSNPTSEVKPEEKPKQQEAVKNNNGSAVLSTPESVTETSPSITSKITILEAFAGENTIKVEHPAEDLTLNFYRNHKYEGSGNIYYFYYKAWGNRASFNYPGEALKPGDILRVDTKDSSGQVTKGKEFSVSDMSRPEDKVTVNNLKAGKSVTIEGETMEIASTYEIYVNGKRVTTAKKNKYAPDVYSVQVPNLNKGDIVTVLAKDISESGQYTHGSVTTTVQ